MRSADGRVGYKHRYSWAMTASGLDHNSGQYPARALGLPAVPLLKSVCYTRVPHARPARVAGVTIKAPPPFSQPQRKKEISGALRAFHRNSIDYHFEPLRDIRERLLDSSTFSAARADLEALLGDGLPNGGYEKEPMQPSEEAPTESDDQTIERLLGKPGAWAADARPRPPTGRVSPSSLTHTKRSPEIPGAVHSP